jgi:hypothetical protein
MDRPDMPWVESSSEAPGHLGVSVGCNTSGVTMARAHLGTKDCDHMWEKTSGAKCKSLGG